ncbi:hypothetical protein SEA_LIFES_71 [Microbacterium phage Lifes]|nr:hypothetical protein SEA_LIFES_71 [Microbacterium phage Lifes]
MDKTRIQAQFMAGVEKGSKTRRKGENVPSTIPSEQSNTLGVFEPGSKPINVFQMLILKALNNPRLGKHVYAGTADSEVVAKRRAKNKVARKQRKVNNG